MRSELLTSCTLSFAVRTVLANERLAPTLRSVRRQQHPISTVQYYRPQRDVISVAVVIVIIAVTAAEAAAKQRRVADARGAGSAESGATHG